MGSESAETSDEAAAEMRLVSALMDGDAMAIGGLYDIYRDRIYSFCLAMLGNRADAEDATAETFIRAIKRSRAIEQPQFFKAWLFRIARNHCIDRSRSKQPIPAMPPPESMCDPDSSVRVAVRAALASLPKKYRDVIILIDLEGFSQPDAAAVIGMRSTSALKQRLYRARRKLRMMLPES